MWTDIGVQPGDGEQPDTDCLLYTSYFRTLKYLFVDGILYIASTENIEHVRPYIGEIHIIIVNRTFDVDAPCINMDNVDAAYQAVKYLIENGHRKIALYLSLIHILVICQMPCLRWIFWRCLSCTPALIIGRNVFLMTRLEDILPTL